MGYCLWNMLFTAVAVSVAGCGLTSQMTDLREEMADMKAEISMSSEGIGGLDSSIAFSTVNVITMDSTLRRVSEDLRELDKLRASMDSLSALRQSMNNLWTLRDPMTHLLTLELPLMEVAKLRKPITDSRILDERLADVLALVEPLEKMDGLHAPLIDLNHTIQAALERINHLETKANRLSITGFLVGGIGVWILTLTLAVWLGFLLGARRPR